MTFISAQSYDNNKAKMSLPQTTDVGQNSHQWISFNTSLSHPLWSLLPFCISKLLDYQITIKSITVSKVIYFLWLQLLFYCADHNSSNIATGFFCLYLFIHLFIQQWQKRPCFFSKLLEETEPSCHQFFFF